MQKGLIPSNFIRRIKKASARVARILSDLGWFLAPWIVVLLTAILIARLSVSMPGRSHSGPVPPLSNVEDVSRERLRQDVDALAGEIGERNVRRAAALEAAARYIHAAFRDSAYPVSFQEYRVRGTAVKNVIAQLTGVGETEEMVVVGAHYDSVGGSPGANDNATGVAALLEIARQLSAGDRPRRTVRFIAFVNEEPPFFQTDQMGSWVYAREARRQGDKIVGMLSLETIGYYDDEPNSQHYPFGLGLLYPSKGNFIGFVSDPASKALLFDCISSFRRHTPFPSEGLAAAPWITGVDWSDQWSFWEKGYRAVMVTDTALFRYPHYHSGQDTPDKIDYDSMARVVVGLSQVVRDLAK